MISIQRCRHLWARESNRFGAHVGLRQPVDTRPQCAAGAAESWRLYLGPCSWACVMKRSSSLSLSRESPSLALDEIVARAGGQSRECFGSLGKNGRTSRSLQHGATARGMAIAATTKRCCTGLGRNEPLRERRRLPCEMLQRERWLRH